MTATSARGPLHLAAAVDQPVVCAVAVYTEQVRLAEHGRLDFVTLGDGSARPAPDALTVLAGVAPQTRRIGLVPTVPTAYPEPFHVREAVAMLDRVSRGRAGWRLGVPAAAEETRPLGRPGVDAPWQEAGEAADGVAGLWDSPEYDAEARDAASGHRDPGASRHHADPVGSDFPEVGPSTVPCPPHGPPVRVVDATDRDARQRAARSADVALVHATGGSQAAALREELRSAAARFGRDPNTLRVLASLVVDLGGEPVAEPGRGPLPPGRERELGRRTGGGAGRGAQRPVYRGGPVDLAELIAAWHTEGAVDGFHLVPAEPRRDLERLVNGTVVLLQHRGLFRTFYPGGTLREHLCLDRTEYRGSTARAHPGPTTPARKDR
jgi:alkanesulfonate monooxygenase SsuD/methylene tetrahydromethanopterin reductase-like flavin-dependent oxidoreductase (luciferase family)